MTDTVIDVPAPPASIDVEIADFRKTHDEALNSRAHVEHSVRAAQLSALFEKKFSGDVTAVPEPAKPESRLAVKPDVVGGDQPADDLTDAPLTDAGQVSFDALKAKEIPGTAPDEKLEAVAKEWVVAGGLNAVEAEGLSLVYAASINADVGRAEQIGEQHLRSRYGHQYREAASAAARVIEEVYGLRDFLDSNPAFAANPQVIDKLVSVAEKRGFFKRSA